LGNVVPGYEWYLAECRRVGGDRARFVSRLEHDDPLLASAYAACSCLVLSGGAETPGLAALEAAMAGTPLVLREGGCASEYFGRQALYIQPDDLPGTRQAVRMAMAQGRSKELAQHVRTYFSTDAVAKVMREVYQNVIQRR
jgi:glycosyltransferase involved in cell wall biosynthesis